MKNGKLNSVEIAIAWYEGHNVNNETWVASKYIFCAVPHSSDKIWASQSVTFMLLVLFLVLFTHFPPSKPEYGGAVVILWSVFWRVFPHISGQHGRAVHCDATASGPVRGGQSEGGREGADEVVESGGNRLGDDEIKGSGDRQYQRIGNRHGQRGVTRGRTGRREQGERVQRGGMERSECRWVGVRVR